MTFCLIVLTLADPPAMQWGGVDYVQYHVAWELILAGKNPYEHERAGQMQMAHGRVKPVQMYAPAWSLLPSLPLVGLPFHQAVIANVIINCFVLILVSLCWAHLLFPGQRNMLVISVVALPLWLPCLAMVAIGQISVWPLLSFTAWLFCTTRRQPTLAGCFLALTIIKPHLGLLPGVFAGMYALRHAQWKTVAAFILCVLAATALMWWLRPTIWGEYLAAMNEGIAPSQIATATFDGWGRYYFGHSLRYLTWTCWALALLVAAIAGWRCPQLSTAANTTYKPAQANTLVAWSALCLSVSIVVVPYAFSMDFVFMLPGFILALGAWVNRDRYWQVIITVWLVLELWMVAARSYSWDEHYYWFIPWIGLLMSITMQRHRLGLGGTLK
jgi:hypothetical protein